MMRISVQLTPAEQEIVASERYSHPDLHVRRKMFVLWAVHAGLMRAQTGQVAGVGRATVQRYLAAYRVGPVPLVLDNARYQRNQIVQDLAAQLGIRLLLLPSYSPNLNLIERLWGFLKRQSVYGKYHANFESFRSAIEATWAGLSTTHAAKLATLMTLKFQEFDDVSLLAA